MKITKNRLALWTSVSWVSLLYLFFISNKCPELYIREFYMLTLCHVFMMFCLLIIVANSSFYIFEPMVFVFFLYYMIFVFTPIQNIMIGSVEIFGCNTMGGCIKATFIFMLGYASMLLGYYLSKQKKPCETRLIERYKKSSLLVYSWIVWIGAMGIYLLYNRLIGRSIIYMLTFGLVGSGLKEGASLSVDFMSLIVYCAFVPMMNILIYEKSKYMKILVFYITCVPLATRGFRSALIVPLIAPFIYSYIKKKKTPPFRVLILVLAAVVLMIGSIEATRSSLRIGEGVNLEEYSYSDGIDGVIDYFGAYKVFYGAVENYPNNYNYTWGGQLAYTFTMYIPRLFWPSKPSPLIHQAIENSTNYVCREAGAAWPNIGEYYTDFGVLGVIICMFFLGMILKKMKKMYNSGKVTNTSLAAYSLFLPALILIIAYGYTAGNAPTFVFIALPILGQKCFVKREYTPYGM